MNTGLVNEYVVWEESVWGCNRGVWGMWVEGVGQYG